MRLTVVVRLHNGTKVKIVTTWNSLGIRLRDSDLDLDLDLDSDRERGERCLVKGELKDRGIIGKGDTTLKWGKTSS